jgi:hypothetical protein
VKDSVVGSAAIRVYKAPSIARWAMALLCVIIFMEARAARKDRLSLVSSLLLRVVGLARASLQDERQG